jgi:hypothetical protein
MACLQEVVQVGTMTEWPPHHPVPCGRESGGDGAPRATGNTAIRDR